MGNIYKLMDRLGHQFNNIGLLETALSHRSIKTHNNERLEFLGDSVLGFIVTSELYRRYPSAKEGELSRMRASVVNGQVLAQLSIDLGVSENVRLGFGERKNVGMRPSILADALEAVVAAIYLDAGLEKCRCCLLDWYGKRVDDLSKLTPQKDPKSRLQEWLQARKLSLPIYEMRVSGEAHARTFMVICYVEGLPYKTEGISTTRRRAEQIAALRFLELVDG